MLREALEKLDDPDRIAMALNPPQSDGERVMLMNALWDIQDLKALRGLLQSKEIADSVDASVTSVRDIMLEKLKL